MSREQVVEFCKTITPESDPNELLEFAASVDIDLAGTPIGVFMAVGGPLPPLVRIARDRRDDPKLCGFLDVLKERLLTTGSNASKIQPLIDWNSCSIQVCQEMGRDELVEYFTSQNEVLQKQIGGLIDRADPAS